VRCGRCGNENSGDNRFCGMCGASLVANEAVPVTASPIISVPRIAAQSVPATRVTPPSFSPSSNPSPVINGPSFLGLNKPTDGRGNDRLRHSSDNLDYLLDDDDDEPKRGWGKLAVAVIALALIGGFGYLRWKQGGFNFLKPAPVAQPSQAAPDSAGQAGTAATPDAASPNNASANTANPNPASPNPPAPDAAAPNPPNPNPATPDAAASGSTPAPATGGTASSGAEGSAQQPPPANATAAPSTPADNPPPAKPEDNASRDKSTDSDSTENSAAEPAKSGSDQAAEAKPSATRTRERKPTPATPADPTPEAERYVYGRGVRQDCDRGLRLLKPAAAQSNAKAMIALGALYSSGTCTPRDLPTAYRWFALALHKQPDNQPLQDDLQKLWTQMTQPERQLAIKLTQ
jgi:hypothetical protein